MIYALYPSGSDNKISCGTITVNRTLNIKTLEISRVFMLQCEKTCAIIQLYKQRRYAVTLLFLKKHRLPQGSFSKALQLAYPNQC